MPLNKNKDLKQYYSIKEVAEMFDVNESLLRYWEKIFPTINPEKVRGKIRRYTKADIEQVRRVYHLLKEKRMTMEGALQNLKTKTAEVDCHSEVLDRLLLIRNELAAMKKELDYIT